MWLHHGGQGVEGVGDKVREMAGWLGVWGLVGRRLALAPVLSEMRSD